MRSSAFQRPTSSSLIRRKVSRFTSRRPCHQQHGGSTTTMKPYSCFTPTVLASTYPSRIRQQSATTTRHLVWPFSSRFLLFLRRQHPSNLQQQLRHLRLSSVFLSPSSTTTSQMKQRLQNRSDDTSSTAIVGPTSSSSASAPCIDGDNFRLGCCYNRRSDNSHSSARLFPSSTTMAFPKPKKLPSHSLSSLRCAFSTTFRARSYEFHSRCSYSVAVTETRQTPIVMVSQMQQPLPAQRRLLASFDQLDRNRRPRRRRKSVKGRHNPHRPQRQPSSFATAASAAELSSAIRKANELLDERQYPLGFFSPDDFEVAKEILYLFRDRNRSSYDDEITAVRASLDLWFRCLRELQQQQQQQHNHRNACEQHHVLASPFFYAPLLNHWKDATRRTGSNNNNNNRLISPHEMLAQLQAWQHQYLPQTFFYNTVVINMVVNAVLAHHPPEKAPYRAQKIIDWMEQEAAAQNNNNNNIHQYEIDDRKRVQPTVYTYNPVIAAWAQSGQAEAASRIQNLRQRMQERGIAPTTVTFHSLLHLAVNDSDKDSAQAVDNVLREMKERDIKPDLGCWLNVLTGYSKAGRWKDARRVFQQHFLSSTAPSLTQQQSLYNDDNKNKQQRWMCEAALRLLQGYRSVAYSGDASHRQKDAAYENGRHLVQAVWEQLGKPNYSSSSSSSSKKDSFKVGRMLRIWLDILALMGRFEEAEVLVEHLPMDVVKFGMLLKAYGRGGVPERASEKLQQLVAMNPRPFPLEVSAFNSAINAWAEPGPRPDAVEQAAKIMDLLRDSCQLEANTHTFTSFLRCLSHSKANDAGARAEQVLEAMDRQFAATEDLSMKPTVIAYNLALRACYNAGDLERAQTIMDRMQQAGSLPNRHSYKEILMHFAAIGTIEAAERCEAILKHMHAMAETANPELKPDSICYNITRGAWERSDHPDATDQMWKVYENMQANSVQPDFPFYRAMFGALLKIEVEQDACRVRNLDRADELLDELEQYQSVQHPPNPWDHVGFLRSKVGQARGNSKSDPNNSGNGSCDDTATCSTEQSIDEADREKDGTNESDLESSLDNK